MACRVIDMDGNIVKKKKMAGAYNVYCLYVL